jgi:hypothetical protein
MATTITCPKCQTSLYEGVFNRFEPVPCPGCETPLQIDVFPAMFRKIATGPGAEAVMVEGESSCFFHPEKKAVVPCHGCGRFLCALCDCELKGEHYCPSCLETGKSKGKIKSLENQRTLYDSIALTLVLVPMLTVFLIYFTLITAPMTLFIAIRYWKAPQSILRRSKFRFVLAIILAVLQMVGWVLIFGGLYASHNR